MVLLKGNWVCILNAQDRFATLKRFVPWATGGMCVLAIKGSHAGCAGAGWHDGGCESAAGLRPCVSPSFNARRVQRLVQAAPVEGLFPQPTGGPIAVRSCLDLGALAGQRSGECPPR
jgi:hypothetical protein